VRYPVAFIGSDRKVEITGEAYFEVTHDARKPFIVSKGETSVTVLGTHFNVNAYDDEDALRVTLLEGSVKVSANNNSVTIKPNEQAVIKSNAPLTIDHSVDVEQVMAWKNGLFRFNNTNILSIMQQVKRWYDVDVVYEIPTQNLNFSGFVGRKENVSQLLKIMELTGLVRFKVEGKKITVIK
jgi:ferric-dicitrate binding protein FerR (iron transport regulator)